MVEATDRRACSQRWRDYSQTSLSPILEAALHCFMQHGYHGTTIRTIAASAGLSVPGVYHHFPSKHTILVAVMKHAMDDLWWRSQAAFEEAEESTFQQFVNVIECMLQFHTHRTAEAFIAYTEIRSLDEAAREAHISARDRQQELIDDIVERGASEGLFETPTPSDASRAVVTMCTAVSQWFQPTGELSPEELARRYCDIALRAVGGPVREGGTPARAVMKQ